MLLPMLVILSAGRGWSQLPPVSVPRGVFRIDLGGEFLHADSRFEDGTTQDLGHSFTTPEIGGRFFPTLAASEASIGRIIGDLNYRLNAGSLGGQGLLQVGTGYIGAAYGLTSKITVFATLPIVQTRMQAHIVFDSTGANAGFNPADPVFGNGTGPSQTTGFFLDFNAALGTLSNNISSGAYDANPTQKAQAQAALAQGTTLRDELLVIFADNAAPVVPIATSTAGVGLTDSIGTYQATLSALSVTGFSSLPALPAARISPDDFANLVANPVGPVAGFPLQEATRNRMGDLETGIGYTLVDRWNRDDHAGGFRAALEARVRFPTGLVDRSDDFLDIGTGTGHLALGLSGTVDLGAGRIGVRMRGGFEHSFSRTLDLRVSGAFQPIAFLSQLSTIQRQPGNLFDLSATPFFRLAPALAVLGGVRLRRHSLDRYSYAQDSLAGVSASVLAEGSDWSLASFLAGVSYQNPASTIPGSRGFPIEASWTIEGPLSSSRGIVAKQRVMRLQLRMYTRLFK
jgi:hypothetical protein